MQRFQVTRVDGFRFNVRVTTPPKATGKLPALFWIYPREYPDQETYNRSAGRGGLGGGAAAAGGGRYTSPGPRSMTLLCRLGYAVVEPDVPIVGPAGRMNDNYVPDLRNSLWAVIDDLDKKGIIDRDRLAIGGHSYGAFSTANALAHTPFFKAGIAGDGNYNRTLTAMSFQTRATAALGRRETYLEMSPALVGQPGERGVADVPRDGGRERRHGPDQRRAPVPGPGRTGQAGVVVHVPLRGPRTAQPGNDPGPVGPLGGVAGQVCEGSEGGEEVTRTDSPQRHKDHTKDHREGEESSSWPLV